MTEMGIEFRSAAGDIDGMHAGGGCQQLEQAIHRLPVHQLGALRARFHMTVQAGLIAELAGVHLQDFERRARERDAVPAQRIAEGLKLDPGHPARSHAIEGIILGVLARSATRSHPLSLDATRTGLERVG